MNPLPVAQAASRTLRDETQAKMELCTGPNHSFAAEEVPSKVVKESPERIT
jgi:hypothetical protein